MCSNNTYTISYWYMKFFLCTKLLLFKDFRIRHWITVIHTVTKEINWDQFALNVFCITQTLFIQTKRRKQITHVYNMKKAKKQARQHSRLPEGIKVVRCLLLAIRQWENLIYPVLSRSLKNSQCTKALCSSSRHQSRKAAVSIGCQQVPLEHCFHDNASWRDDIGPIKNPLT